jgi:glycosyltransferase involved in cell wall biosynthesis
MRITFLLPTFSSELPIGGYKVHYEYANRLSRRGHAVTIVQPLLDAAHLEAWRIKVYYRRLRHIARSSRRLRWFQLDAGVNLKLVFAVSPRHLPRADVLIATGWETVQFATAQRPAKGVPLYIVYDYERLQMADAATRRLIEATYTRQLHAVATSSVVREVLAAHGVSPLATIPCGVDFTVYHLVGPLHDRPRLVGFPARLAPDKGLSDVLEAMKQVRAANPKEEVGAVAYGPVCPSELPSWVHFIERPTDQEIAGLLNECRIFVVPSYYEAWGLPAIEAMACGAALVTYDNGGSRDYAIDEVTALVARPRNPTALAAQINRLLDDDHLRCEVARAGCSHVLRYDWDRAVAALESCLISLVGGDRDTAAGGTL